MKAKGILMTTLLLIMGYSPALAKVDLVILPKRDAVQLTIYNSADLTLVRDQRTLTFMEGLNSLQFSWANTLIDPTSLDMLPKSEGDNIDILGISYPPQVQNLGVWQVESRLSGKAPVEISYLTSGLSWRAFYMGTLSSDEKTMHLKGYVRVTNNSGEDYEEAQVRMIVGKVNLIDRIADLARRQEPYGRPGPVPKGPAPVTADRGVAMAEAKRMMAKTGEDMDARPKEIKKEGLSEYFLYTIEGKETIPHGWSKRLPSFTADDIPVINLYKYELERYGSRVMRFLSFKNDKDHYLGDTPIPGGALKVYRKIDEAAHLSYEGQSRFKYIPVNDDVELNLGAVSNVIVKTTLMAFRTDRYLFDRKGNVGGWDEIREFDVEIKNTRSVPIKVEIKRHFETSSWELKKSGNYGQYEKVDLNTVKFLINLDANEKKTFHYTATGHHGTRAE